MIAVQTSFDSIDPSFPFQDEIREGESGQGYALRMAHGNGLPNLSRVKHMLGKSHSTVLDANDAAKLAQWFGGSVQLLEFALERLTRGRREEAVQYAGQAMGRSYFLTRSYPRVCPDCVRELRYCRIAWDISLSVACVRHRRVLSDRCPNCERALSWNRPGLDACNCGCLLSMGDIAEEPSDVELLLAHTIDQRMEDYTLFNNGDPRWELRGEGSTASLASLLRHLSLDGVMRIVYALATAAMYNPQVKPQKRERESLGKVRQTIALASAFGARVSRLQAADLRSHRPTVLINLLGDISLSSHAPADDLSLARSILGWLLINAPNSTSASRHPSLAQLQLF